MEPQPPRGVLDPGRLAAVRATGLLDTEPEEPFDRLAQLAAAVLRAPAAFVTLVDDRRSFWKAAVGVAGTSVAERQTPVEESFCQYVIEDDEAFLVSDARADARTRENPSIARLGVVAWAGYPVRAAGGATLGTLCVVDTEPHEWSPEDAAVLKTLAGAASSELRLRDGLAEAMAASRALGESEARFRLIADAAPVMVWMADADGTISYLNARWLEHTGGSLAEDGGQGWVQRVHPDDRGRCVATYDEGVALREGFELEYRLRRADGRHAWVLDRGVPRHDPDGAFAGFVGCCVDVDERHRDQARVESALTELAGEREALRRLLTQAPAGIGIVRGPELRLELVNALGRQMIGVDRELLGRPIADALPELEEQGHVALMRQVYASGRSLSRAGMRVVLDRGAEGSEEAYFDAVWTPISGPDGAVEALMLFGVEVTDQMVGRRAVERAAARVARLGRVTAALSQASTPAQVSEIAVRESRDLLGAQGALISLIDATRTTLAVVNALDLAATVVDRLRCVDVGDDLSLARCVSTGEPIWLSDLETWRAACPTGAAVFAGTARAAALIPLDPGDGPLGVLLLAFAEEHDVPLAERELALTLASQCAQAMQRANLYAAEQRARAAAERAEERARLLAEVSLTMDAVVGVEERLDDLAQRMVPRLADLCTVRVSEADGDARLVASAHHDPARAGMVRSLYGRYLAPDAPGGPLDVIRSGRAALISEATPTMWRRYAPDASFLAGLQALRVGSYLSVPLAARGRVLGALTLMTAESGRRYGPEDLELALEIGRRAGLALDNARLYEYEREVATALQEALLPERLPEVAGLSLARRYVASAEPGRVGGDWYEAIVRPDGRLVLCVGDVVGRGPQAAAVMGQLRAILGQIVRERLEPGEILQRLSAAARSVRGARVTTAVICLVDGDSGEVRYACAGHPPPLLVSGHGEARLLWEGRSPPLAVGGDEVRLAAVAHLEPGDVIVLYTDGLVERRGEGIDEALERLRRAVGGLASRGPEGLCAEVLRRMATDSAADDIALLALRRGDDPGRPLRVHLPAQAAELGALRGALRAWLRTAGARERDIGDVVLACSEAAANAVEHAYLAGGATGGIDVEARMGSDGVLRLEVRDDGTWREDPAPGDRGRGIELMRALMDEVAIERAPRGAVVRMSRRVQGPTDGQPRSPRAPAAPEPSATATGGHVVAVRPASDKVAVVLGGEIDHASAGPVGREIDRGLERVPAGGDLEIDLTSVTFLDSAGVRLLIELGARLAAADGTVRLVVRSGTPPARAVALADVEHAPGLGVEERPAA